MTDRLLSDAALAPSPRLVGAPLASPIRRVIGFAFDCILSGYTLVYSIGDEKPARPGTIRLDMGRLAHDRLANTVVVRR